MAKRKSSGSSTPPKAPVRAGETNVSRTRARREARKREQQRQRQITIAIAIVIGVIVIGGLILLLNQPQEAPVPEESLTRYEDLTVSTTSEGFYRIGDPQAPVRVEEYSSFSCPACRVFHDESFPGLLERVRNGEISFTYIPLTLNQAGARSASRAAFCAGEQEQRAFWVMHDALFNWFGLYGANAYTDRRLSTGIENLGLDAGEYDSCIRSSRPDELLDNAEQAAGRLGSDFTGTPTFTVQGAVVGEGGAVPSLAQLNAEIDSALRFQGIEPGVLTTPDVEEDEGTVDEEAVDEEEAEVEPTAEATDAAEDEPTAEATEAEAEEPTAEPTEAESEEEPTAEPEATATDES